MKTYLCNLCPDKTCVATVSELDGPFPDETVPSGCPFGHFCCWHEVERSDEDED